MAIKKTELYSSLWASCDELRGGMDASQYKDYVLTLLFVKYVSDKFGKDAHGLIIVPEGGSFSDMLKLKNDKEVGDKMNKIIAKLAEENDLKGVIDVADFNDEDKLGKGKAMVDRLSNLLGVFESIDLSSNRADGDDLLGDAYEYLMRHFATDSGKSKGQFYTPAEVSRILAKVVGITDKTSQDQTVYDPTCGSGSLLLKVADESSNGLTLYGQEMDNATSALARMNMILHGSPTAEIWQDNTLSSPHWKNKDGSLKTFHFAVANPPFSFKAWSTGLKPEEDEYGRFEYGIPPDKNGDYAFLLHILKSLKSTGKGAVILPHGVLFRGNVEATIRRNLIRQGVIKGIIGLPANLFYGTGIQACIIIIDKENAVARRAIFMMDASKGFIKQGNKNRLRAQDIHKIVDIFNHQIKEEKYSRLVSFEEIEKNDFNLNIPRYIDSSADEDLHDLNAHLSGGIPNRDIEALNNYWEVFPSLRKTLFDENREGYSNALVNASSVKNTILVHTEFKQFAERSIDLFHLWKAQTNLSKLDQVDIPKEIIHRISEALLNTYNKAPLLDRYDMYQIIMDYWAEVMQDDVYVITQDGWLAGQGFRELVTKKGEKSKETPDIILNKIKYKMDILPPYLIVNKFFKTEQKELDILQSELDAKTQELETLTDEHGDDEAALAGVSSKADANKALQDFYEIAWKNEDKKLFDEYQKIKKELKSIDESILELTKQPIFNKALNAKSKLTLKGINEIIEEAKGEEKTQLELYLEQDKKLKTKRKNSGVLLKAAKENINTLIEKGEEGSFFEEIQLIHSFLSLTDAESDAKKTVKLAQEALDKKVFQQYPKLTESENKTLIVEDKWLTTLQANIVAEIERVTQQLANRVKILEERYAEPLPVLIQRVELQSDNVDEHLKKMGFQW